MRDATVRYYFDADILGLAHVVCRMRSDCTYPGDVGATIRRARRPACPITPPATKDHVWIPEVSARGWLAITRDADIRNHPRTIAAMIEHAAKIVILSGPEARSPWGQLEVLMCQWRRIEQVAERPGPLAMRATRSGVRDIGLAEAP